MDINKREFYILLPLVICTLFFGLYPLILLNPMHASVYNIVSILNPLLVY